MAITRDTISSARACACAITRLRMASTEKSSAPLAIVIAKPASAQGRMPVLTSELGDEELQESDQGMGGGSDDIAEVSWNLPTIRLRYAGNIPGRAGHHWSSGIAMATPIAHKGANYAARVIAMTAIDLLANPERVEEAWRYHREVTTKDHQWKSLIPQGTDPPIFLNAEKMERYRARLEELRYDPARFDTYLEQLGIDYPTVREAEQSE